MAKQRKILYLATAVLLILAMGLCLFQIQQDAGLPFSVVLNTQSGTQTIQPWEDEDGVSYVFLPGYASLTQVYVDFHTSNEVLVNGERLTDGMTCGGFSLEVPYDLSYETWGRQVQHQIKFVKSANVAAMFIDTRSGSMDYIHEKKGNSESGTITLYFPDGRKNYSGELNTIQGRGNNTWEAFKKKPYSLRLSEAADLLQMGCAENWILLANADDPSHIRNKLAFEFAQRMGLPFSPDSDWVDLYLNGEYAGLYLLSERNEVHQSRVDIAPQNGVLLSLENEALLVSKNEPYVKTGGNQTLRIHYPEPVSDVQLRTIAEHIQSVENAILTGRDPATGKELQDLIDMDSWVENYVLDELLGNLDAFWVSRFFYYDTEDGKLMAGPVWDYDKALGNDNTPDWSIPNGNAMVVSRYGQRNNGKALWANELYLQPEFRERLAACYAEKALPLLMNWVIPQTGVYEEQITEAARLNDIRWNCYAEGSTHETEIAEVVSYLQEHARFLNAVWIDGEDLCQVGIIGGGFYYFYGLPRGAQLPQLPAVPELQDMTFLGWCDAFSGNPFDLTQPITEDVWLYGNWVDTSNPWPGRILKLVPLGLLLAGGGVILCVDISRWRSGRRKK